MCDLLEMNASSYGTNTCVFVLSRVIRTVVRALMIVSQYIISAHRIIFYNWICVVVSNGSDEAACKGS